MRDYMKDIIFFFAPFAILGAVAVGAFLMVALVVSEVEYRRCVARIQDARLCGLIAAGGKVTDEDIKLSLGARK